jgi:hypothetical protein
VTTAQLVFSIALGVVVLAVTIFAVYVVSATMWTNRWFRK